MALKLRELVWRYVWKQQLQPGRWILSARSLVVPLVVLLGWIQVSPHAVMTISKSKRTCGNEELFGRSCIRRKYRWLGVGLLGFC